MANLENIISQKTENDAQWKEARQAERENAIFMQDAGMVEITSDPDVYARYLEMQGDNPAYSTGNIVLVMFQMEGATVFGTRDRWKTLGRTVMETETGKGVKIFTRSTFGKGYVLADAYDVSQTQGRALKEVHLHDDSKEMETALTMLLNYSVVPVTMDKALDGPALYDEEKLELVVNPDYPDSEAFAAIATEIALSRIHAKGANAMYDRSDCEQDAQSVSYILCRRFGVKCELPGVSQVAALYEGWEPQERRAALDYIHDMSKQIGGSIERGISPQPRSRAPMNRPVR
ncbi:MAG TPA: hypothetical protein VN421_09665 [Pseudoflavonifractor sp.]|nr:hypothetical protein [Pseudoflavonifractor sp.]